MWEMRSWALCDVVYAFNNGGFFPCTVGEKLNDSLFKIAPIGGRPTSSVSNVAMFHSSYKQTQVDEISLREEMIKNNVRAKMTDPGPRKEVKILKPAPPTTGLKK